MAKFIELTNRGERTKVLINVDNIESILDNEDESETFLYMINNHDAYNVKESYEEIKTELRNVGCSEVV